MNIKSKLVIAQIVSIIISIGAIAMIICGAIHLDTGAFNISDAGAIAMIVIGGVLVFKPERNFEFKFKD